jgi:hypothetical protein
MSDLETYNEEYWEENTSSLNDSIWELEETVDKMQKDIRILWETVILPYRNDLCRSQILDQIDEHDFDKFYRFMISKSPAYKKAMVKLNYLYSLQHKN